MLTKKMAVAAVVAGMCVASCRQEVPAPEQPAEAAEVKPIDSDSVQAPTKGTPSIADTFMACASNPKRCAEAAKAQGATVPYEPAFTTLDVRDESSATIVSWNPDTNALTLGPGFFAADPWASLEKMCPGSRAGLAGLKITGGGPVAVKPRTCRPEYTLAGPVLRCDVDLAVDVPCNLSAEKQAVKP